MGQIYLSLHVSMFMCIQRPEDFPDVILREMFTSSESRSFIVPKVTNEASLAS